MSKYTFTSADVEAEVRRIAAKNPEHVYQPPREGGSCKYVHYVNGHREPGCLIGQALAALGVSMDDLWTGDGRGARGGMGANRLILELCGEGSLRGPWLQTVQAAQDDGSTWGRAVQVADEEREQFAS